MTGMDDFRILKAADSALVFEFGTAIDRKISDRVLGLAEILNNAGLPGATEIVATFRSLCVNYDSLKTTGAELEQSIVALMKAPGPPRRSAVCGRFRSAMIRSSRPTSRRSLPESG